MPRDSQRSKIYSAERENKHWGKDSIKSFDDCVKFAKNIVKKEGYALKVKVLKKRGYSAHATRWSIVLSKVHYHYMTVLHELAHTFTSCWCLDSQAHGEEYASTYLYLVRKYLPEAADELQVAFEKYNVKYSTKVAVYHCKPLKRNAVFVRKK